MVSYVSQYGNQFIQQQYPWTATPGIGDLYSYYSQVSKEEFDKLKKELELLKDVLVKAKIYDEQTGQPDCEMEEKVKLLKRLGELVGVDLPI